MSERKLRRIITRDNADGKSEVEFDGPPRSLGSLFEMWITDEMPVDNSSFEDKVQSHVSLGPPPKIGRASCRERV